MIININNPPLHAVEISRQGENEFREIVIDVSSWLAEWPDGKISVIYSRPDGELYPVIVNASESPIIWRPTATDTAVSGVGAIEVRIQIGDVLGKSCTIEANVLGSLGAPGGTPAAPAPDWTRTVTEDADRAEAAAEKAEAASTHMPQISANKTWLVWDADAGEYVDTGVSAAGEKGDEGDPGKAPIIGSNGNWYEWDETAGAYTDTGKPSRGKDGATGATGATGEKGSDGKSAYAYAVDGGYTGTEAEFEAKLAAEMPDKLPNPNALTFTGAATGNYDGSEAVTVNIPTGGGGSVTVFANDVVVAEAVAEYKITGIDPTEYSFFLCKLIGTLDTQRIYYYVLYVQMVTGQTGLPLLTTLKIVLLLLSDQLKGYRGRLGCATATPWPFWLLLLTVPGMQVQERLELHSKIRIILKSRRELKYL